MRGGAPVLGRRVVDLPLHGEGMVPRQTETLPRSGGPPDLPAGQRQSVPGRQLRVVHGLRRGAGLVPDGTLPGAEQPGHHESSLQRLHGKETPAVLTTINATL